jgi:hypothetical protein
MSTFLALLPITALIAIVVFICRETLEFFRRRNGDQRKLRALTALLARECELNFWSIKTLRRIFSEVHTTENENPQIKVEVKRTPSGRPFARIVSDDGGTESHVGIPKVHRELMSKFLLDVAMLDKKLFEVMEPAYDGLAEVEHIRESLMNVQDAPEFIGESDYLEGLAGYALDELQEAEKSLASLYKHCTGHALTKHRLR